MLDAFGELDNATLDERDAFLLGNQGPDPLFFLAIHPSKHAWHKLGSRMHSDRTNELMLALRRSLGMLEDYERDLGRAYAQGFLAHFMLDSTAHPLINSRTYALCDAGVDGLSRADKGEVHAEIERDFDQMMLTIKRGQTIRDYPVVDNTLEASPELLAVIDKIYAYLALSVYGQQIPSGLFATGVECYRITMGAMHSPRGIKRRLAMAAEHRFRPHSLFGALAHRALPIQEQDSWFANPKRETWEDHATGQERNESFLDLYQTALDRMAETIELFEKDRFAEQDAEQLTRNLNFSGEPTVATLVVEE